jgi:hypothetical protein
VRKASSEGDIHPHPGLPPSRGRETRHIPNLESTYQTSTRHPRSNGTSPREVSPSIARYTPPAQRTTGPGRSPGFRVIKSWPPSHSPKGQQWQYGRTFAGYSCGGSAGFHQLPFSPMSPRAPQSDTGRIGAIDWVSKRSARFGAMRDQSIRGRPCLASVE